VEEVDKVVDDNEEELSKTPTANLRNKLEGVYNIKDVTYNKASTTAYPGLSSPEGTATRTVCCLLVIPTNEATIGDATVQSPDPTCVES